MADREDLDQLLIEQLDFLQDSAARFDGGRLHEAKRLAATLRVLLHDHGESSCSLLGQLQIKESLRFVDTAIHVDSANLAPTQGLTTMRMSGAGMEHHPAGISGLSPARHHEPAEFKAWWTRTVIKDGAGNEFSRKDLVLALANKEGGTHVDPKLGEKYKALSRQGSLGWNFIVDGEPPIRDLSTPVPASVRQIAAEVLATLDAAGVEAPRSE